ncbi:hypothetical protein A343_0601 [Porphyromonas gingivalis JCVI SC001]|nr:hypothetical protein A343_0601 [Porphyromonas gingivalis JCVI SC001]
MDKECVTGVKQVRTCGVNMDRSGFKRKKSFQNLANPIFFYNIAFRNRE